MRELLNLPNQKPKKFKPWNGIFIALLGAVILFFYPIVKEGFAVAYQQGTDTEIVCDVCGRAVKNFWAFNIRPVSRDSMLDRLAGAMLTGSSAQKETSVAGESGRHYDLCPDCWQKFKVFFHAEKNPG